MLEYILFLMELCCSSAPPVPFCTRNEIAATKAMIFDSQLHMDEQLVLVSGDYMDRLSVVGHLHAEI